MAGNDVRSLSFYTSKTVSFSHHQATPTSPPLVTIPAATAATAAAVGLTLSSIPIAHAGLKRPAAVLSGEIYLSEGDSTTVSSSKVIQGMQSQLAHFEENNSNTAMIKNDVADARLGGESLTKSPQTGFRTGFVSAAGAPLIISTAGDGTREVILSDFSFSVWEGDKAKLGGSLIGGGDGIGSSGIEKIGGGASSTCSDFTHLRRDRTRLSTHLRRKSKVRTVTSFEVSQLDLSYRAEQLKLHRWGSSYSSLLDQAAGVVDVKNRHSYDLSAVDVNVRKAILTDILSSTPIQIDTAVCEVVPAATAARRACALLSPIGNAINATETVAWGFAVLDLAVTPTTPMITNMAGDDMVALAVELDSILCLTSEQRHKLAQLAPARGFVDEAHAVAAQTTVICALQTGGGEGEEEGREGMLDIGTGGPNDNDDDNVEDSTSAKSSQLCFSIVDSLTTQVAAVLKPESFASLLSWSSFNSDPIGRLPVPLESVSASSSGSDAERLHPLDQQ